MDEPMRNLPMLGLAFLAITILASLAPAYAVFTATGPLDGTATSSQDVSFIAISTMTIAVHNNTDVEGGSADNVITYVIEVATLVKGAPTGDIVKVTYNVTASCTLGTCPEYATIGSLTPAVPDVNQSGGTVTDVSSTANTDAQILLGGDYVQILSGSATLDSYPPHGRNTVAQLGSVEIAAVGFDSAYPEFSIAWFNSGKA
jgi:hypothetical protein